MEFLKFLGKNAKDKFYARDFRNNYRFRPDVNPPRIKFEGYVNFVFNRDISTFLGMENNTYKTNNTSNTYIAYSTYNTYTTYNIDSTDSTCNICNTCNPYKT